MTRSILLGLVFGTTLLALSCTGHAADESAAKKTIIDYLRAEAKGDYTAMTSLFTPDARLKYTYRWGYGYEDSVYEIDFSKPIRAQDQSYLDDMNGYEILDRRIRIKRLDEKPNGETRASVIVREKYRYEGYTGTAETTLDLVLRPIAGKPRIARLTSLTKY